MRQHHPEDGPPTIWSVSRDVATLWQTVFGLDNANGLRSTSRSHEQRLSALENYKADVTRATQAALWLSRYVALAAAAVIGAMSTGPAADAIVALLRAGAGQ